MAEIKQNFSAGKMNKDLDERLIPKGQYRHAENIQVSTSETADVGAVENISSNIQLSGILSDDGKCVGVYSNEKDNSVYWFTVGGAIPVSFTNGGFNNNTPNIGFVDYTQEQWDEFGVGLVTNDKWMLISDFDPLNHGMQIANGSLVRGGPVPMPDTPNNSSARQLVDIVAGVEYRVSYDRRYTGGVRTKTNWFMDWGDGNQTIGASEESSGNFVTITDTFTASVTGTMEARIFFIGDTEGQIDNVSITSVSQMSNILKYKNGVVEYVFVDMDNSVLKFNPTSIITGINIIDNLLLWTDNETEPKKINIDLCIQGTENERTSTKLIVPQRDIDLTSDVRVREEHITVIKKAPKTKLTLVMDVEEDTTALLNDMPFTNAFGSLFPMAPGTIIPLVGGGLFISVDTGTFVNQSGPAPTVGDEILLLDANASNTLPENYNIKLKILADLSGTPTGFGTGVFGSSTFRTEIVDGFVTSGQEDWYVYKAAKQEDFFEKQFARFSYRYKYQDGEYSTFAPFSEIAFKPADFDYETKKAYNLGMQNKLKELTLKNFVETDILEDVVQIDLLYKESNSPNVYIVETLKYNDYGSPTNNWEDNEYQINSDLIYALLPSNQLLRPYDNVPRKALAQEITGNRIVYGNYVQNYDLTEKPVIDATYTSRTGVTLSAGVPNKSLKSLRNYQLGISYIDEYGRETPVFSNTTSSFQIPKYEAESSNALQFTAITSAPDWAKSYKLFVKETSNEYYNLAMDRVYRAEDGNVWMSFPSSERNKIDEETFLILKKQLDSDVQVADNLKYKVIAIENEAPVEVKTDTSFVASSNGNGTIADLFTGDMPLIEDKYFQINEPVWKTDNGPSIDNFSETLSIKFRDTAAGISSDFYEVAYIEFEAPHYNITLKNKIKKSDSWIFNNFANITSFAASNLNTDLSLRIYRNVVKDQPKFDGRFFVKILNDISTEQYVLRGASDATTYTSVGIVDLFYISDKNAGYTNSLVSLADLANTGTTSNWESSLRSDWVSNILNFNNNERSSEWFIDQVWYAGSFTSGDIESSYGSPSGFGKGIYKVPGGGPGGVDQWYMELSFSLINPDPDSNFIEYGGQGDALIPVVDGNYFRGRLNEDIIRDPMLFAVGSSLNPDHEDQNSVTSQLKQNKLFKFVGDQNTDTKYIINGTVTSEKRFNYMPFTTVRDAMDRLEEPPQGIHTGSSTLASNSSFLNFATGGGSGGGGADYRTPLQDAWNDFTEAFNRRVTYIIPFALYDQDPNVNNQNQPIYEPANPLANSNFVHTDGTAYTNFIDTDADSNGSRDGHGADNNSARSVQFLEISEGEDDQLVSDNPAVWETEPKENIDLDIYYEASECFDISLHGTTQELDWFNCYSFNNGVESNRLRDDFNQIVIDKGAIASSTIDFVYEEENRKSGLIFSGLYNSTNGVNNLNQFISAENIIKDINPTYGSIQKLFSRNTDLVTFCEDKVIRILANKDAIFNADGNPNLVATPNVLGQTMPFTGDFGISNNPESFVKESYRAYFTDKNRGAVLRLSMDGITPISDYGMADFFRDNLKNENKIIGSFDEKKKEYNLTLPTYSQTVSFKEDVKGWTSFKSFVLEQGASVSNEYYTFKNGNIYEHHNSDNKNNFYGNQYDSKITTILNDQADVVKSFKTINYEGTQSYVNVNLNDNNYYNLSQKDGWKVENIKTDKDIGFVPEFIGKEGKWFNNIKGKNINTKEDVNTSSFSFQGVGRPSAVEYFDVPQPINVIVEVFMNPTIDRWFVLNNSNQTLLKRGLTGSSGMFNDPNEPAGSTINPNLIAEQIFGGNVYRQGETVDEIVQFKIRPGIDISQGQNTPVPIQASYFSARHLPPPGPDGERSRAFDGLGNFIENIQTEDGAGGAVEDKGPDAVGFINSTFSPISANVNFVDTHTPNTNENHVLLNVPIKFTVPETPGIKTIRIELFLEYQSLNQ